MKKVGIISLYYNSKNYGGLLQAYALNKYISELGYNSELISYKRENIKPLYLPPQQTKMQKLVKMGITEVVWRLYSKVITRLFAKKYAERLTSRTEKVSEFRERYIRHSKVYTEETISESEKEYDIFISGSDQIWKPGVVDDGYVFNFLNARDHKIVFSYASSVSVSNLPGVYIQYMKKALAKYSAVSLREEATVEQFKRCIFENTKHVLDPTLLVDRESWHELAGKRRINGKYIFCYMLGDDRNQRKQIKEFAKKKGLKLVTLPHIVNGSVFQFKTQDWHFGDVQLYDIGIPEFLSLIQHAEIVVTDSFHAGVFSYVFHKEFYLLERPTSNPEDVMNVRIYDLVKLYGTPDRVVSVNENLVTKTVAPIDYSIVDKNVLTMQKSSREFLSNALKG